MKREIIKKQRMLLVLLLIAGATVCGLFYSMFRHDTMTLDHFTAAYYTSDKATADFASYVFTTDPDKNSSGSRNKANDLENKAVKAHNELKAIALSRVSSLVKNDAELMRTAIEICDYFGAQLTLLDRGKNVVLNINARLANKQN